MEVVGLGIWLLVMLAIFAINIVGLIFWIWMIIDCAMNEPSDGNDKIIWIIIVVFLNWIGALIYFFARRPTRIAQYGR